MTSMNWELEALIISDTRRLIPGPIFLQFKFALEKAKKAQI